MYYAITINHEHEQLIALEQEAEQYLAMLVEAHSNPVAQSKSSSTDTSWMMAQQSLKQFLTVAVCADTVIAAIITEDMID
jgi:hypothetical protein